MGWRQRGALAASGLVGGVALRCRCHGSALGGRPVRDLGRCLVRGRAALTALPRSHGSSDDRSPEAFRTCIEAATQMESVLGAGGKPNCLVIDEIDGAPVVGLLGAPVGGRGGWAMGWGSLRPFCIP